MAVQGSGYTRAAGAEAEHCNGEDALRQGAATAHGKGGLGGKKKNGMKINAPPPPPPPPPPPLFINQLDN